MAWFSSGPDTARNSVNQGATSSDKARSQAQAAASKGTTSTQSSSNNTSSNTGVSGPDQARAQTSSYSGRSTGLGGSTSNQQSSSNGASGPDEARSQVQEGWQSSVISSDGGTSSSSNQTDSEQISRLFSSTPIAQQSTGFGAFVPVSTSNAGLIYSSSPTQLSGGLAVGLPQVQSTVRNSYRTGELAPTYVPTSSFIAPTGDSKNDFYATVYGAARDRGLSNTTAHLAASQAVQESGWGRTVKGNNLFGVKAGSSWEGKTQTFGTHEYINGQKVNIADRFRAYDTPQESIDDYIDLTLSKFPDAANAVTFADAVQGLNTGVYGKYATDPKYGDSLKSIKSRAGDAAEAAYQPGSVLADPLSSQFAATTDSVTTPPDAPVFRPDGPQIMVASNEPMSRAASYLAPIEASSAALDAIDTVVKPQANSRMAEAFLGQKRAAPTAVDDGLPDVLPSIARPLDRPDGPPGTNVTIDYSQLTGKNRPNKPDDAINMLVAKTIEEVVGPGSRIVAVSGTEGNLPQYGSRRHKTGLALDFAVYDPNGNRVTPTNSPEMAVAIAKQAAQNGAKGVGMGQGYMGGNNFHIDLVQHNPSRGEGPVWGGLGNTHESEIVAAMGSTPSAIEQPTPSQQPSMIAQAPVQRAQTYLNPVEANLPSETTTPSQAPEQPETRTQQIARQVAGGVIDAGIGAIPIVGTVNGVAALIPGVPSAGQFVANRMDFSGGSSSERMFAQNNEHNEQGVDSDGGLLTDTASTVATIAPVARATSYLAPPTNQTNIYLKPHEKWGGQSAQLRGLA